MAVRVPAGEMRHKVTIKEHKIEAGSTALDSYGQVSTSTTAWTQVLSTRAKLEQLSGNELVIARQQYATATHRATVDYHPTLGSTGGSRRALVFGTRWLHIGAVIDPDLEHLQLQLLCGELR